MVGKVSTDAPKEAFVQDMVGIISRVNEVQVHQENIEVQVGILCSCSLCAVG